MHTLGSTDKVKNFELQDEITGYIYKEETYILI